MSGWTEKLRNLLREVDTQEVDQQPRRRIVNYLSEVVIPAFEEVAGELQDLGRDVEVEHGHRRASIRVVREGNEEFYYEVRVRPYREREFAFPVISLRDGEGKTYRAEAFLRDQPLKKDLTDFTREELIEDFLREYERHLKWHL